VGEKAERVSRFGSCVVGAEDGDGGGSVGEKPLMDQRTMQCSRAAFENIRSPYQATLIGG
jgi:hypothetical protein